MMLTELHHLIPVETPLGRGYAILIESEPHDQWWTVVLDSGAVVTFPQERIRVQRSYTLGRGINDAEMTKIVEGN